MPEQHTASIKTVGCRLNQAESAQIRAQLESAGYQIVPFGQPADLTVVHSCAVTTTAESKCAGYARAAKKASPQGYVVIAGCAAEISGEYLLKRSGADLLAGQEDKFRIPELILAQSQQPHSAKATSPAPRFDTTRALLKVQDGCDFRCAYCVVPDARGNPVSRPMPAVLAEAERMARDGFREVVVTGANLGVYRDGDLTLIDLLRRIEQVGSIDRIRLSSIECSTVEREVVDFMADSDKLCHYLHLPLQTGDDSLLQHMGRRYSVRTYRELIEYAVERLGSPGLGSDILVGLPGEDEQAFGRTVALVETLPFSNLHVFSYSRRPGTRAARMPAQVPHAVKRERSAIVRQLAAKKKEEFAARCVGTPVSVLIERMSGRNTGKGWTGEYVQAMISKPGVHVNDIVKTVPDRAEGSMLIVN